MRPAPLYATPSLSRAQGPAVPTAVQPAPLGPAVDKGPKPPGKVDVLPHARDPAIKSRLTDILTATGWFENSLVEVRDGVVFLSGTTQTADIRHWAEELASNTQDVAAVVNHIEIRESPWWNLSPARRELRQIWTGVVASLPYLIFGVVILLAAWWSSRWATSAARRLSAPRIDAPLLKEVFARSIGLLIFFVGLYFVLHFSGLTRLAVTVIGGTGLLGLVIGIAFRDITENFLASVFLSIQRPFQPGDLIAIAEDVGYVQTLNTRTTILMTIDGNHVQIPNSTVYKSTIRNFTSNPNRRESFHVGIGYQDQVELAQAAILQVLEAHPAVLTDPAPWVLVDGLGSAAVDLQVYFWLNGSKHNWLTVKSSVIRLVKSALEENRISMPFETRSSWPPLESDDKAKSSNSAGNGRNRRNGNERSKQPNSALHEGGRRPRKRCRHHSGPGRPGAPTRIRRGSFGLPIGTNSCPGRKPAPAAICVIHRRMNAGYWMVRPDRGLDSRLPRCMLRSQSCRRHFESKARRALADRNRIAGRE